MLCYEFRDISTSYLSRMEDRFRKCYNEYKQEKQENLQFMLESRKSQDRFRCLIEPPVVKFQDTDRFRCLIDTRYDRPIPTSPLQVPTPVVEIPSPSQTTIYYSTKTTTPTSRPSFEERYERARREKLPASPLHLPQPRRRQNSSLSLASEESFPSLPSAVKSTPTTPVLGAWSSVVQKNMVEDNYKKPRVRSERLDWEEEFDEEMGEEIVYDEDGFPRFR